MISIVLIAIICFGYGVVPSLSFEYDAKSQLQSFGLSSYDTPLRLHLGCGGRHLDEYVNIDFAPLSTSINKSTGADAYGDITQLKFFNESVDEIRSHHVFEHFTRQNALALLYKWHQWLRVGGMLHIVTPDLDACLKILANTRFSYQQKQATLRHIFGSHEDKWAIHCDGWYEEKFRHVLTQFGFDIIDVEFLHCNTLIPAISIKARKVASFSADELTRAAYNVLDDSLINRAEAEFFSVWRDELHEAIRKMSL